MVQADSTGRYVTTVADEVTRVRFPRLRAGRHGHRSRASLRGRYSQAGQHGRRDSAPHIDVIVLMRGMLLHTYTRIYFDDEVEANARDAVLAQVPEARRGTLIARREPASASTIYRFDVRLQGEQETVFFDL